MLKRMGRGLGYPGPLTLKGDIMAKSFKTFEKIIRKLDGRDLALAWRDLLYKGYGTKPFHNWYNKLDKIFIYRLSCALGDNMDLFLPKKYDSHTKVKVDGSLEWAYSDTALEPGRSGQAVNTSMIWYRINNGEWKRAGTRSSKAFVAVVDSKATLEEFKEFMKEYKDDDTSEL